MGTLGKHWKNKPETIEKRRIEKILFYAKREIP